jgi:hypothetical protein
MLNIAPTASAPIADPHAHWPDHMRAAYAAGRMSGQVGSVLVSETDRVRVWHLTIPPGKACGFHRHVLPYFWTCLSDGVARGWFEDGSIVDTVHTVGQTKHLHYGAGEHLVHAVENIGTTELRFTTVEFLDGDNAKLPIAAEFRLS